MNHDLLQYYEAIERAKEAKAQSARTRGSHHVAKPQRAIAVLSSQLKHAAAGRPPQHNAAQCR